MKHRVISKGAGAWAQISSLLAVLIDKRKWFELALAKLFYSIM